MIITNENYDKLRGYVANVDGVLDNMEGDTNLPLEAFEPQKYSSHGSQTRLRQRAGSGRGGAAEERPSRPRAWPFC